MRSVTLLALGGIRVVSEAMAMSSAAVKQAGESKSMLATFAKKVSV